MPRKASPAPRRAESRWFELSSEATQQRRLALEAVRKLRATLHALRNDPGMTPREQRRLAEADQRWATIERRSDRG